MEARVSAEIKLNTNQFRRLRAACQWSALDVNLDEVAALVSLDIRRRKNINGGVVSQGRIPAARDDAQTGV